MDAVLCAGKGMRSVSVVWAGGIATGRSVLTIAAIQRSHGVIGTYCLAKVIAGRYERRLCCSI